MAGRAEFRQNLINTFSSEELQVLCNDLGVDPDLIPDKNAGKNVWADQIITYFERRKSMPILLQKLRTERRDLVWEYTPTPFLNDFTPRWPVLAGVGVAVALGVVALVIATSRPTPQPTTPTPTAVATATAPPTPTSAPVKMPEDRFNIIVAQFGQVGPDGVVSVTHNTKRLSENVATTLKNEMDGLGLPAPLLPEIWHSQKYPTEIGIPIGAMQGDTPAKRREAAQQLAEQTGAGVIIYGNLELNQSPATFTPEFYVAPLANEAEELIGRHQLGAPVPVPSPENLLTDLNTNAELKRRQDALAQFTVGLIYDYAGSHSSALEFFKKALANLRKGSDRAGEEVAHYFIGREHLYLYSAPGDHPIAELEQAEQAFSTTLGINSAYARGHIGMGSAHLARAQYLPWDDAALLLVKAELIAKAIASYTRAKSLADTRLEPFLQNKAVVSLGIAYYLQGEVLWRLGKPDEARTAYTQATINLITTVPNMRGQYRLLAQAYLAAGNAYSRLGDLDSAAANLAQAKEHNDDAVNTYELCADQRQFSTQDMTLRDIASKCDEYLKSLKKRMAQPVPAAGTPAAIATLEIRRSP